jgi:hypothetical protein
MPAGWMFDVPQTQQTKKGYPLMGSDHAASNEELHLEVHVAVDPLSQSNTYTLKGSPLNGKTVVQTGWSRVVVSL